MTSVSVIVPCRNEKSHIVGFLKCLASQVLPADIKCEYLVADGMSDDGTRELLASFEHKLSNFRILDNPQQTVSAGLNAAIRNARGEVVIRMDVHSEYASNYISECVRVLQESGAQNVGGPALAVGTRYLQRAICLGYRSPFGCGGAKFHDPNYEGYVDTVTYGCWHKSTLEQLGLFDEALVRNQDDELNLRITRNHGKIWQSPRIQSWYHPRASLTKLARQYSQYGYWKVHVIRKHRMPASWRHLVPAAFAGSLIMLSCAAPFVPQARALLTVLVLLYAACCLAASFWSCRQLDNFRYLPVMPLVFCSYHVPYGLGFLRGLWDASIRKNSAPAFSALIR